MASEIRKNGKSLVNREPVKAAHLPNLSDHCDECGHVRAKHGYGAIGYNAASNCTLGDCDCPWWLEPNFPRSSQNQTVSSGVEGAHEGTTADKDSHEIAKKIVDANAWERASGGWYIDESAFENLQIDIAEAIHDAESREPEKFIVDVRPRKPGETAEHLRKVTREVVPDEGYLNDPDTDPDEPEKLNNAPFDRTDDWEARQDAKRQPAASPELLPTQLPKEK